MQTKSRNTKLFGMNIFEIGVLVGLGLILCVTVGLGAFILYANTNPKPAVSVPPTFSTPPTFQPTYTSYPTYTPLPTFTPVVEFIQGSTVTPLAIILETPNRPLGERSIRVNSWLFDITEIHSDPGKDNTRQVIVLIGNLTNEGMGTDTFVAMYHIVLKDSQGRLYEEDISADSAARSKYQTDYPTLINPGATAHISLAFEVPVSEKSFLLTPGSLVSGWSGDISFTVP